MHIIFRTLHPPLSLGLYVHRIFTVIAFGVHLYFYSHFRSGAIFLTHFKKTKTIFVGFFVFLVFVFLGPHSQHVEVPRLAVESEL